VEGLVSNEIKVGDEVRSYDLEYRRDSYVEGVVKEIVRRVDGKRYRIESTLRVVCGDVRVTPPKDYFPPVNGTPGLFGGIYNSVKKLDLELN